jgi:hypothetical protein
MHDGAPARNWPGQVMKIAFERTGGFMGRKVSLSLELDELPADQSATLKWLVEESDFFNLDDSPLKKHPSDQFLYTITVDNGITQHTVHTSDSSAPEALRPLLHDLMARTRMKG